MLNMILYRYKVYRAIYIYIPVILCIISGAFYCMNQKRIDTKGVIFIPFPNIVVYII